MKVSYYAVCNVNGPISIKVKGSNVEEALESFNRLDKLKAIDKGFIDVEKDLKINGEGLTKEEFEQVLKETGLSPVCTLDNMSCGCGWQLWIDWKLN